MDRRGNTHQTRKPCDETQNSKEGHNKWLRKQENVRQALRITQKHTVKFNRQDKTTKYESKLFYVSAPSKDKICQCACKRQKQYGRTLDSVINSPQTKETCLMEDKQNEFILFEAYKYGRIKHTIHIIILDHKRRISAKILPYFSLGNQVVKQQNPPLKPKRATNCDQRLDINLIFHFFIL